MPAELTVTQPRYPLPELTTYELRDYRRALERAIARSAGPDPVSPDLAALRLNLDAVTAEQESRTKLTAGDSTR
jgi:DNA-binding GntR family transcriptional regulator